MIAAEKADKEGEQKQHQHLLLFPKAQSLFNLDMMRQFGDHIDLCKECCELLGVSQNAISLHPAIQGPYHCPVPAVLIKTIPQGSSQFSDVGITFTIIYAYEFYSIVLFNFIMNECFKLAIPFCLPSSLMIG